MDKFKFLLSSVKKKINIIKSTHDVIFTHCMTFYGNVIFFISQLVMLDLSNLAIVPIKIYFVLTYPLTLRATEL